MLKLEIRKLKTEDIPFVMEIEEESFGEYHWSESSFASEIQNALGNYVAAIDGSSNKFIGYAGFWSILDEGHITTFAVHKDYRRQGVANNVMLHLLDMAYDQELKWFTLEVRASNISAISFYKKFGFESIGVREKYYQDNDEDALIMWTENIYSDKFKSKIETLRRV